VSSFSACRYQYLELAFFLTYGHCPNMQPSDYGYILSEKYYNGWDEFFKNSSAVLNVDAAPVFAREICVCARLDLQPRLVNERRSFVYEDMEVGCRLCLSCNFALGLLLFLVVVVVVLWILWAGEST
jgi:hypothetical protein